MSCITQLLEMKGEEPILHIRDDVVIEGGGVHKGYEYIITFVGHGHRCGYVAVGDDVGFDSDSLCVHGDITFSDTHHCAKDLLPAACEDLWLGFDAAHGGDLACYETSRKYFPDICSIESVKSLEKFWKQFEELNAKHRSYEYMENQCKSLIDQVIEQRA